MEKQPIPLRPLIGLSDWQRRALLAKAAEVARWCAQQHVPPATLAALIAGNAPPKGDGG